MKSTMLILCVAAFVAGPSFAETVSPACELRLANVFNDNMVLQQGKPVRVWGWARPGVDVEVTITADEAVGKAKVGEQVLNPPMTAEQRKLYERSRSRNANARRVRVAYVEENVPSFKTVAKTVAADADGLWVATFEPMIATFAPKFVCVAAGPERAAIKNVLVGEVWIAAGQSNMEWKYSREDIWERRGLLMNGVRYTTAYAGRDAEWHSWYRPVKDITVRTKWAVAVDGKMHGKYDFVSAIAYMFGDAIHRRLKVPVGIVMVARGGSMGWDWASLEELRKLDSPPVKDWLASHAEGVATWLDPAARTRRIAADKAAHKKAVVDWQKRADEAKKVGKDFEEREPRYREFVDSRGWGPGRLFNGRIAPIGRLAVKGVIFLQGEQQSLVGIKWPQYEHTFPAVIRSFRTAFGEPDLPFGIITLQGMGTKGNNPELDSAMGGYAVARDIHYREHLKTPGTGFICAHDIGGGVHPNWKRPVAERTAYWALNDVYDLLRKPKIRVKNVTFRADHVYLTFQRFQRRKGPETESPAWIPDEEDYFVDHAAGWVNDTMPLSGFAVAGADKVWRPAKVSLDYIGRRLVVRSDLVAKPVALRYGWGGYPHANLGDWWDPVPPFRTDNWRPFGGEGLGPDANPQAVRYQRAAVAARNSKSRQIRQGMKDAHLTELRLHGDAKGVLASKVARMAMILDEMDAEALRDEAKRLSAEGLSSVTGQYYRPAGFWAKWQAGFDAAVRLDALPDQMAETLKDKAFQKQIASVRKSLAEMRKQLSKLPDPEPATYESTKYLLDRAKAALARRGIEWRRLVRGRTPITPEDLKPQQ